MSNGSGGFLTLKDSKQTTPHGLPARIRLPRYKAPVRILMKDGVPCDEVEHVTVPARPIWMRDRRRACPW